MGLLGDLALGVLNYALSANEKKNGVIFDPDGLNFPFSDKDRRNNIEEMLLTECAIALNVSVKNSECYCLGGDNDGYIQGFVVTNGVNSILHGLFGMGKCGIVVTGENYTAILENLIPHIQEIGFSPIELCDDQIPFHNRTWLVDKKNVLEQKMQALIQETSTDESDSLPDEQIIAEEEIPHEEKNPLEEIYSGEKFQEIKQLHETTLKKLADSGAMNKDKERLYKKFSERFLLANEKPAKIAVAKKSFAKNSTTDIPLVMYDETLSKSGELGYLLTNKKLYIGNREVDPIEVELASVNSIVAKPKLISSFIAIDDVQLEASSLLKEQLFAMADFLEKAVPLAMQIESVNEEVIEERPAEESSISVSENPKEDIEALYVAVAQNGDESFTGRFFLSDSNPKKVIAAVKAYAKNCKGEEILVAYDDSAFGNGKVGFLLSNKKLYICNSFEKPQEIELSAVQSVSATPKSMNSFITVNDIKIDMTMVNGAAAELIAEFLQKAIPLAKQIEVQSE